MHADYLDKLIEELRTENYGLRPPAAALAAIRSAADALVRLQQELADEQNERARIERLARRRGEAAEARVAALQPAKEAALPVIARAEKDEWETTWERDGLIVAKALLVALAGKDSRE